MVSDQAQILC